jgi:hypothetical protein
MRRKAIATESASTNLRTGGVSYTMASPTDEKLGFARSASMKFPRLKLLALCGLLALTGVAGPAKMAPKPPQKAWFEAKSVCLFRLGDRHEMPGSTDDLSSAIIDGWKNAIVFPKDSGKVSIEDQTFPKIGSFTIDLSDGHLKPASNKDKVALNNRVERELHVGHFDLRGEPILIQAAKVHMHLTADDALMKLERDRHGKPMMMLADASSGSLQLDVTTADAEKLMLDNARQTASKYAIIIDKLQFTVVPETPRELDATLYVGTRIALVPAGMLFRAHVSIDDSMNAKITGLTCDGDEVLGPLIVGMLRPAIARYNNETRPLVSFPTGDMKLHDVGVAVDDSLHLHAAFGK